MRVEEKRILAICLFLSLILASGLLAIKVFREAHVPTKKGTVLSITPSNFTAGDSLHPLTATITDADGNPVWGKAIVWSVTLGTISPPTEEITNSFGQITVEYQPSLVDVETPTRIIAEFVGDKWYEGSQGFSDVTIVPGSPPPPPL